MSKKRMNNILIICSYILLVLIVLTMLFTLFSVFTFGETNIKKVKTIEEYYGNDFNDFFSRNEPKKSDEYDSIFKLKF